MIRLGSILQWFRNGAGLMTFDHSPVILSSVQNPIVAIEGIDSARVEGRLSATGRSALVLSTVSVSVKPITGEAVSPGFMEMS